MRLKEASVLVTGGASGLGLATAERLIRAGAHVTILDLPSSAGAAVATRLGSAARFVPADVTDTAQLSAAVDAADARGGLRGLVHCAGAGRMMHVLDSAGKPGRLADFETVIRLNLIATFDALRLAAARIAQQDPIDGERGAIVLTASVMAFDGPIGQINYAAAKAGVVGMTLTAARELAAHAIRVCTIAPGIMDTPLMRKLPDRTWQAIERSVPNPPRLGLPDEYAQLASEVLQNAYLNGETIRLDGALRLGAR